MNRNIYILFLIFISQIFSQERYLDEIFSEIEVAENVVYGNAPDLPFLFLFEWNTVDVDLDMNIYEPSGDTEIARPVIIFLHPGSFFSGSNNTDDMVSLATDAAKRGYVGIAANYRLGLNVLSTYSGERAVWRGVQDASSVIRYLREYHEELRIDPEKIFLWGSSAGSFISLHLAYYDDSDRPESTYGSGNDPDLGCIDCTGNNFMQDSRPNAIVSCWGAIAELDYIDQNDNIPAIMFHGSSDIVVPYDYGLPFTINIALPIVYGSSQIHDRLNSMGIQNEVFIEEGQSHEYWGSLNGTWISGNQNEYYYQILSDSFNFLYQFLDDNADVIEGDINSDQLVNVLDIVLAVDNVLNNQYLSTGDINNDYIFNILDIIIIVNIIIGDNN
tara:strand:- start:12759 stop:13919 length:1161 start_codon:yes stop_codon:yes gene_type:complete